MGGSLAAGGGAVAPAGRSARPPTSAASTGKPASAPSRMPARIGSSAWVQTLIWAPFVRWQRRRPSASPSSSPYAASVAPAAQPGPRIGLDAGRLDERGICERQRRVVGETGVEDEASLDLALDRGRHALEERLGRPAGLADAHGRPVHELDRRERRSPGRDRRGTVSETGRSRRPRRRPMRAPSRDPRRR